MKIAVIGANGKAGSCIVKEAVSRGLDVTAVVRKNIETYASEVLVKDLFDLITEDIAEFDVLIDAFGAWTAETLPLHTTSLMKLADLVSNTDKRLLVVGGAGSLYVDESHQTQLADTPEFPDDFKPLAKAMGEALSKLRERNDVNWTYISPAADFRADGERTGQYKLAGEELTVSSKGESVISYADYAIAVVDEATNGDHIKQRISVVEK